VASRDDLTFDGELLRWLRAEPFEPFTISLSSGERVRVDEPQQLIIGQNVATLFWSAGGSIVIRKSQLVAMDSTGGARP